MLSCCGTSSVVGCVVVLKCASIEVCWYLQILSTRPRLPPLPLQTAHLHPAAPLHFAPLLSCLDPAPPPSPSQLQLPLQELPGAVRGAGLDKTLAPAVAAGLGKPLQEAFRTAFSKQLLPAFESATQEVFQQINTALAAGLQEHVQVGSIGDVFSWLGPGICAWCICAW